MIIALSGPSGIGKGYFKDVVLKENPNIQEVVWYTTRGLRPNEHNRKSVDISVFNEMVKAGELVLVQEVFDHFYGVKKDALLPKTGIWLTEIHPFNMLEAKTINPHMMSIGMITEDIDLLKERLTNRRKTESIAEINKRLSSAKKEMEAIKSNPELFDQIIIVNHDNEHLVASMAKNIYRDFLKGA